MRSRAQLAERVAPGPLARMVQFRDRMSFRLHASLNCRTLPIGFVALALLLALPLYAAAATPKKADPEAEKLEKVAPKKATPAQAAPSKAVPKKSEPPAMRPVKPLEASPRAPLKKTAPGTIKAAPVRPPSMQKPAMAPVRATPRFPRPKGPGDLIEVAAPVASQRVQLGTQTDIRWRRYAQAEGDPDCGREVDLYAVRLATNESHAIAERRQSPIGTNSYGWNVSTTFYYDIRGDYRIDVVSTSAPAEPKCRAQSAAFRILSSDEMAETSGESDYDIDYVQFADGRSLDRGVDFDADGIRTTVEVGVRWNREGATPSGASNTVEIRSDVTGDLISQRTNPEDYDHSDADASGLVRVSVPITIEAGRVLAMKRDRFIPLRVQLRFSDGSVDAFGHNNREVARMRVLDTPPIYDLEIVGLSGFSMEETARSRRLNYARHSFSLTVQVRNLSRNDAGGALPDLTGAQGHWGVGSNPPHEKFSRVVSPGPVFELSTIPGGGASSSTEFPGRIHHPQNWWTSSWIEVRIEPPEGVIDPNPDNNTMRFDLPTLP